MNLRVSSVLQPLESPQLLEFPKIADGRGCLCFVEARKHVPFDIERVYYINDVPHGESRGSHAHKSLRQVVIIPKSGSLVVDLDDGQSIKKLSTESLRPGDCIALRAIGENMRDFTSGTCAWLLRPPIMMRMITFATMTNTWNGDSIRFL